MNSPYPNPFPWSVEPALPSVFVHQVRDVDCAVFDACGRLVAIPTSEANAKCIAGFTNGELLQKMESLRRENAKLRDDLEAAQGRGFARKLATARAENKYLREELDTVRGSRDRVDSMLYAKTAEHSKMRDLVGSMKHAIEKIVSAVPFLRVDIPQLRPGDDGHIRFGDCDITALLSEAQAAIAVESGDGANPAPIVKREPENDELLRVRGKCHELDRLLRLCVFDLSLLIAVDRVRKEIPIHWLDGIRNDIDAAMRAAK